MMKQLPQMPAITKATFIIGLAASFYIYEFFIRTMPAAMSAELMHYFHITASGFGIIAALFFYGYAPLQIPAGILIDRFGPRKLLTIGCLIAATCSFAFVTTHYSIVAGMARLLMGVGSSVAYIATLVLTTRWFASKYFALIAGSVQFLGCLGAILGLAPVAALNKHLGWQSTLYIAGSIGILLALAFWLCIKDYPDAQQVPPTCYKSHSEQKNLKYLLSKMHTWWIGLSAFASWAPSSVFGALWGVSALSAIYHLSNVMASGMISLFWLGIACSGPVVGWWSDRIRNRRLPLITASIIGVTCPLLIFYASDLNLYLLGTILFIYGFSAASQALTFALVKDNTPQTLVGTAIGINNTAVVLSGVFLQPTVGFILHSLWSGRTLLDLPVYTANNYRIALTLLPLCSLFGLIINLFSIKETHCRPQY